MPAQQFEFAEWVEARVSARMVENLHRNRRVAAHVRSFDAGLHTTDPSHRAPSHAAYAAQTADYYLRWAGTVGPNAKLVVAAQFDGKPEYSLIARKASAHLKALAGRHGTDRFEAACARAEAIKLLTVKSVRSILQRRLDEVVPDYLPLQAQLPLHQNVRGADNYRAGGA